MASPRNELEQSQHTDSYKTAPESVMDDRELDPIDELKKQLEEKNAIIESLKKGLEDVVDKLLDAKVEHSLELLSSGSTNSALSHHADSTPHKLLQILRKEVANMLSEDSDLRATNKLLREDHLVEQDKDTYLTMLEDSKRIFRDEMEKIFTEDQNELEEKNKLINSLSEQLSLCKLELEEAKKNITELQQFIGDKEVAYSRDKKDLECQIQQLKEQISVHTDNLTKGQRRHSTLPSSLSQLSVPQRIDSTPYQNDEPTMCDLANWVILHVSPNWKALGDQLHLPNTVLCTIEAEQRHVKDCCREVLVNWRDQETSPYTWATVIDALQSPAMGSSNVAKMVVAQLDSRHKKDSQLQ